MEQTKKRARLIFWVIITLGIAIPWIVGVIIKLYLSARGRPTWPWLYFLEPVRLVIFVAVSIWWAIPYIGLAFLARNALSHPLLGLQDYTARVIFISCGLLGGCIGTVIVFVSVFWEFDPLHIFVPLWIYYLPYMGAGLLFGFLIARFVQWLSFERSK